MRNTHHRDAAHMATVSDTAHTQRERAHHATDEMVSGGTLRGEYKRYDTK